MKLTLSKTETKAVEGARLLAAARQKDVAAIEQQIAAAVKQRDAILREVNEHAAEVLGAIAEDQGVDEIPLDKIKFEKKKDGTSTISWPDAPAPKLLPKESEIPADARPLPPVDLAALAVAESVPVAVDTGPGVALSAV